MPDGQPQALEGAGGTAPPAPPPGADERLPTFAELAAGHVAVLVRRTDREDGRPFGQGEPDALAVAALLLAARSSPGGPVRALLGAVAADVGRRLLRAPDGPFGAAQLAVSLAESPGIVPAAVLDHALEVAFRPGSQHILAAGWRALALAVARDDDPRLAGLCARFALHPPDASAAGMSLTDLGTAATYAWVAARLALALDDTSLRETAAAVLDGLDTRDEGEPRPARVLAQIALAADALGAPSDALQRMAEDRIDPVRGLIASVPGRAGDPNPRIALALLADGAPETERLRRLLRLDAPPPPAVEVTTAPDGERLARPLRPDAPPPPAVEITATRVRSGTVRLATSAGPALVDPPLIDLLMEKALARVRSVDAGTIGVGELAARAGSLDALAQATDDRLLLAVAVHERDAALAVLAADPAAVTGDPRAAAAVALGHRRGHSEFAPVVAAASAVWLDAADPAQATVREAERGRFLAEVARGPQPAAVVRMHLRAAHAGARVLDRRLRGTRVSELATAPLLDVALAVAETAALTGDAGARRCARRLLREATRRQLPSGALAATGAAEPDGAGVWPLRLRTQLAYVALAGQVGGAVDPGRRALAFALLHFVDEPHGFVLAGYDAQGTPGPRQSGLVEPLVAPTLLTVARLRWATGLRHRPRFQTGRRGRARRLVLLEQLHADASDGGIPEVALARGGAAVQLAHATLAARWRQMAIRDAARARALEVAPPIGTAPSLLAARAAALRLDAEAMVPPRRPSPSPVVDAAISVCQDLAGARRDRRGAAVIDLRASGGIARLSGSLALMARTRRTPSSQALVGEGVTVLLAAQDPEGRWPALTSAETADAVQISVLEELLVLRRLLDDAARVDDAIAAGLQALLTAAEPTAPEALARRLAVRARVTVALGLEEESARAAVGAFVSRHRGPLGGIGPLEDLARVQVLESLAYVYRVAPGWL